MRLLWMTLLLFSLINLSLYNKNMFSSDKLIKTNNPVDLTTTSKNENVKTYFLVMKYSKEYDIPPKYVFRMLKSESGYDGILHFAYNPFLTSSTGAVGACQVMVSTARMINKENVTKEQLFDTEYNVKTSIKLIKLLYEKYQDWELVFGVYNTGRPIINSYAIKIAH